MRRKIAANAAVALMVLTGCASGPDRTDPQVQREYVTQAHQADFLLTRVERDELVEWGLLTCQAFDEGVTPTELALVVGYNTLNADIAGALGAASGVAVRVMCPEHTDVLAPRT